MCEPTTISMAIAAVAAIVSGVMANKQAQAQASHMEAQAKANDIWTDWQQDRAAEDDSREMGQALAAHAGSGLVIDGSKSDSLAYAAMGQAVQREKIRYSGAMESNSLLANAAFKRGAGTDALVGGLLGAGSSLAGGLSSIKTPSNPNLAQTAIQGLAAGGGAGIIRQ